ncbi:ABC transporter substrate-binding protein [Tomitella fengzijianii]|uniref:ABC transporter substrate-binding protein n=1 Tax=Tomitella fengzijianii TaxID=2597660 RepID=A0A516X386_9ACTN|nr:ABC transporter substrate-binding protein [Tomitella fengzijianii]QDQ97524.1 ABC transporter substrate-binding protein [Tomitella fengzijianii]
MLTPTTRTARRLGTAMAALAVLISGCASNDADGGSAAQEGDLAALHDGMINSGNDEDKPDRGGILTFGAYSEPASLDPAKAIAAVTTGGVEMINIYDSLMRYDAATDSVVPQMAAVLVHDDAFTTWTLTLRDGVAFSDGTPVDAASVKASQERYASAAGPEAPLWNDNVAAIDTPDPRTVVYTLNRAWPDFPHTLTTGAGMIVAPAAGAPGDEFKPIGAGPFTLHDWQPGTSMTLTAREEYWDGRPHLQKVRFVYFPTTQTTMETLFNGGVDTALVRYPENVQKMIDRQLPGYVSMTAAANVTLINADPERPGSDPRLRKALQLAVDNEAIAERGYDSTVFAEGELFADYSKWNTDVDAPRSDPQAARQLVDQVKAEGFDGKLVMVTGSNPQKVSQAQAMVAHLDAVGFDVDLQTLPTTGDQIRRIAAEQDYDLGVWGLSLRDPDPFPKMSAAMHSGGKQVYGMYTSPAMDSLIDEFQSASDHTTKLAIMADIQRQLNEDVPFLVHGYYPEYLAWQKNVHGVTGSANTMVLLGNAWKS